MVRGDPVGGGGRCVRRNEVLAKMKKGGSGQGGRVGRIEVIVKMQKKSGGDWLVARFVG